MTGVDRSCEGGKKGQEGVLSFDRCQFQYQRLVLIDHRREYNLYTHDNNSNL